MRSPEYALPEGWGGKSIKQHFEELTAHVGALAETIEGIGDRVDDISDRMDALERKFADALSARVVEPEVGLTHSQKVAAVQAEMEVWRAFTAEAAQIRIILHEWRNLRGAIRE